MTITKYQGGFKMFYRKNGQTYYIKNINGGNYRSNILTISDLKKWYNFSGNKEIRCDIFVSIKEMLEYRVLTGAEEMKMFHDLGIVS